MDGYDSKLLGDVNKILGGKPFNPQPTVKPDGSDVAGVVDDELSKLGYPSTARLSILGDVGRENSWNRDTIFRGHSDPKNNAFNRGIISWQGGRQVNLDNYLKKQGVYGRNDDTELRGMVRFMDEEMRSQYPHLHRKIRNAKTTAEASQALQQYIRYVPTAPYNEPDSEFGVKANRNWAERARKMGLAQDFSLDDNLLSEVDSILGNDAGFQSDDKLIAEVDNLLGKAPLQESPETIEQQFNSALFPDSPRSAVLVTKSEKLNPLLLKAKSFDRIDLPEGTLFVNKTKVPNPRRFVKQNGFAGLLGKVENIPDTTQAPLAVRTEDANGKELTTSGVSPANLPLQAKVDAQQFPNAAQQKVITPEQAVTERAVNDLNDPNRPFIGQDPNLPRRLDTLTPRGFEAKDEMTLSNGKKVKLVRDKTGLQFNEFKYKTDDGTELIMTVGHPDETGGYGMTFREANPKQPTAEQQKLRENYSEFLTASGLPDNQQSMDEFNRLIKLSNEGANTENAKAVADYNAEVAKYNRQNKQPVANTVRNNQPIQPKIQQPNISEPAVNSASFRIDLKKGDDARRKLKDASIQYLTSNYNITAEDAERALGNSPLVSNGERVTDTRLQQETDRNGFIEQTLEPSVLRAAEYYKNRRLEYEAKSANVKNRVAKGENELDAQLQEGLITPEQYNTAQYEIKKAQEDEQANREKLINEFGGRAGMSAIETADKSAPNPVDGIIQKYGSATQYYKEQDAKMEAWKKIASNPNSFVTEFSKNIIRAIPKAGSSALKTISIGAEAIDSGIKSLAELGLVGIGGDWYARTQAEDTPAEQRGFYQVGQTIDRLTDEYLPQDEVLKRNFLATVLPDTVGQLLVQIGVGALTGGASAPTLLGMSQGASAQYEEAQKFGADKKTRLLSALIGGLAAVPDAIPFSKWLAPLSGAEKAGFLSKLTSSFFNKAVKEVGEQEATSLTRQLLKNMAIGGLMEGTQEVSENKINDALASLTYDKKRKVLTITDEDIESFIAGFIGGGIGGSVETAGETSQMPKEEIQRAVAEEYKSKLGDSEAIPKPTEPVTEKLKPAFELRRDNRLKELGYADNEIASMTGVEKQEIIDLNKPTAEAVTAQNEEVSQPTAKDSLTVESKPNGVDVAQSQDAQATPEDVQVKTEKPVDTVKTDVQASEAKQKSEAKQEPKQLYEMSRKEVADYSFNLAKPKLEEQLQSATKLSKEDGYTWYRNGKIYYARAKDGRIIEVNRASLQEALQARGFDFAFDLEYGQPIRHERYLEQQLKKGKTVPVEVLADYPDLAQKYGKQLNENQAQQIPSPVESGDVLPSDVAESKAPQKVGDSNVKTTVNPPTSTYTRKISPDKAESIKVKARELVAKKAQAQNAEIENGGLSEKTQGQSLVSETPQNVTEPQQKTANELVKRFTDKGAKLVSAKLNDKGILHLTLQRKNTKLTTNISVDNKGDKVLSLIGGNNYVNENAFTLPTEQTIQPLTKGDTVTVKGKTAKVKKVSKDGKKAVVEGVGIVATDKVSKVESDGLQLPIEQPVSDNSKKGEGGKTSEPLKSIAVEGFNSASFEKELESIEAVRDKDGKLLAPNGKVSNLQNERLWKTVRTKAFKKFFGDWENDPQNASKVVDRNGEPMVLTHVTKDEFTSFDKSKIGQRWAIYGDGFYFSISPVSERQFGRIQMKTFVSVKNPYYADLSEKLENKQDTAKLQQQGYDGIIVNSIDKGQTYGGYGSEYVIFEPNQIKSIFNQGSFDANNPSILKKIATADNPADYNALKALADKENFTDEDLKQIEAETDGDTVTLSLMAGEIVRTANALMIGQDRSLASLLKGGFLDEERLSTITDGLDIVGEAFADNGQSRAEIDMVRDAVLDASKENGTAKIIVYNEALPHETAHQVDYLSAVPESKSLLTRAFNDVDEFINRKSADGKTDAVKDVIDTAFKNFYKPNGYGNKTKIQRAVLVQEIAVMTQTGDSEVLGLTAEQSARFKYHYLKSYVAKNGVESIANFEAYYKQFNLDTEILGKIRNEQNKETNRQSESGNIQTSRETVRSRSDTSDDDNGKPNPQVKESGEKQSGQTESERVAEITGETVGQVETKNRKFAESLSNAFYDIGDVEYAPQTEQKWLLQSQKDIETLGVDGAIEKYNSLDPKTAEGYKTALGVAIASELYANGTNEQFTDFGRQLTKDIGNIAQELRASQLLARLSPEHAVLVAQTRKEKSGGILSDAEIEAVKRQAEQLKDISDDLDSANAMLAETEAQIKRYEEAEKALSQALKDEQANAQNLKKDLSKAKRLATYYKNIFDANRTRKTTNDRLKAVKKEVKENKSELLKLLKDAFKNDALMMVAWHGSPHLFDKFSIDKIGTGEGAQVYGYGLYFTDKESIADYYKTQLSNTKLLDNKGVEINSFTLDSSESMAWSWIQKNKFESFDEALDENPNIEYQQIINRWKNNGYAIDANKGAKYKVDLKPSEDSYLLWDKPLSEQSEKVRKALIDTVPKEIADRYETLLKKWHEIKNDESQIDLNETLSREMRILRKENPFLRLDNPNGGIKKTGEEIYNDAMESFSSQQKASEYLKSLGIRGIKYLDGTSRNKGEGSYNYVIFDDADVEITDILKSIAPSSNIPPQVFDALVKLSADKLSDELPNGFTLAQYDAWLDGLTNGNLTQLEKNTVHAQAFEILQGDTKPQTAEQKANLKNRLEHAKRANQINKAVEYEQNARNKQAIAEKEAFRYDKFARNIVAVAEATNSSPETVFLAFGIREFGNEHNLRKEYAEQFPDSKDYAKDLLKARDLLSVVRENNKRALIELRAQKRFTEDAYEKLLLSKRDAEKLQRIARRNIENTFKDLEMTRGQKILRVAGKIYNIPRAVGFSGDAGFLGRQGGKALLTNSNAWKESFKVAFPALHNKEKLDNLLHELYMSDMRRKAEARGAKFKSIGEQDYSYEDWANDFFEEGFKWKEINPKLTDAEIEKLEKANKSVQVETVKRYLKKGGGATVNFLTFLTRRSNTAHGAFLDTLKLKVFEEAENKLAEMNLTEQERLVAEEFFAQKYAPVLTGQGYVPQSFEGTMNFLAQIPLAAPRLRLSHFQFVYYMNPLRAAFLPKGARKIVFQKQARFYTPVLSFIALAMASGLMGGDPEDSDFLKLKGDKIAEWTGINAFKDMRFDLSGGGKEPQRAMVLGVQRLIYGAMGKTDRVADINKELYQMFVSKPQYKKEGKPTETIGTFWRYALHPTLGIGYNYALGVDPVGKNYGNLQAVRDFTLPLPAREVYEAGTYQTPQKDQTAKDSALRTVLSLLGTSAGVGVQNFNKPEKKENPELKKLMDKLKSAKDANERKAITKQIVEMQKQKK